MSTVLEEIKDVQFITNKDGEKTAIVIPLDENDASSRKLLNQYIEAGDYKNVSLLVGGINVIKTLENLVDSINDAKILDEVIRELKDWMETFEDRTDVLTIEERKDEPTISHKELTEELKRDGIL